MAVSIETAVGSFPAGLRVDLAEAVAGSADPGLVPALLAREVDPSTALMAGLALDPVGRSMLDAALDRFARPNDPIPVDVEECVIGGGIHAAIYSAVRVALGFPRPLVIDEGRRFGGTFALAGRPSFFLNSRNRPGPIGAPGSRDALNVLPGAPMQPADIGSTEYQTDNDLGLVARCALALNAVVRSGRVESVDRVGNVEGPVVRLESGESIRAGRVINATGLTRERTLNGIVPDGRTIYSFRQWLARLGSTRFPLADLGRVAVIGSGDSGRVVVESLAGIGPAVAGTVTTVDYVPRIEWFGIGDVTKAEWCAANRSRYQRIGALLPTNRTDNARVEGRGRASLLAPGYLAAQVDGRTFDTVILALGYFDDRPFALNYGTAGRTGPTGYVLGNATGDDRYVEVGPAARIEWSAVEDNRIGENKVGLFRLAPRTAALATQLPQPGEGQ